MVGGGLLGPDGSEQGLDPHAPGDMIAARPGVPAAPRPWPATLPQHEVETRALVALRYHGLGLEARLFAGLKMRLDPMFPHLADLVGPARYLLDVGTGYGVPAVWLLARLPELCVVAVEGDLRRARIAAYAIGNRGQVHCLRLPRLPELAHPVDRALLIDVAHYLSDEDLGTTLEAIAQRLCPGGLLVMRDTVPGAGGRSWGRWLEGSRLRWAGTRPRFRSAETIVGVLEAAGFSVSQQGIRGREETWFVARLARG